MLELAAAMRPPHTAQISIARHFGLISTPHFTRGAIALSCHQWLGSSSCCQLFGNSLQKSLISIKMEESCYKPYPL